MIVTRVLVAVAAFGLLSACRSERATDVVTIELDYLTGEQAATLAGPYLSDQGHIFSSPEGLNTITVRDRRENLRRAESVIRESDASPRSVSLHFQFVRATEAGGIDPALASVGAALRELLRFEGYSLLAQTMVSGSERRVIEQNVNVGAMKLNLAVRINDIVGESGVDLQVDLRRPGVESVLSTNVVVPLGQTVVLGSAYPGADGEALILTVRGEAGAMRVKTARHGSEDHELVEVLPEKAAMDGHSADEAAAHAATAARAHAIAAREARRAQAVGGGNADRALLSEQLIRVSPAKGPPPRRMGKSATPPALPATPPPEDR